MLSFLAAALVLAVARHYSGLVLAAALAGLGNSVFHPADFTLLNRKVTGPRLAHAFSVHGLSGNLGWAAAPALLTAVSALAGWRNAALAAAAVAGGAWAVLWLSAEAAHTEPHHDTHSGQGQHRVSRFAFLGSLPVWMCFGFFFLVTSAFGALQNFAAPLSQKLYGLSLGAAASALSAFLLGGACGIALGGVLASRSHSHERLIAIGLAATASGALLLASGAPPAWSVLPIMAVMGFLSGIAGPSRDMLVRRAATARFGQSAYGRVYGFVYSGLDTGLAVAPLIFGPFMDGGQYSAVWVGVAALYLCAVGTALGVSQRIGAQPA
jgi:predicted MFS family arabinose efflux permease